MTTLNLEKYIESRKSVIEENIIKLVFSYTDEINMRASSYGNYSVNKENIMSLIKEAYTQGVQDALGCVPEEETMEGRLEEYKQQIKL